MKSVVFFDLVNLFAECRLRDVQSVGSPREVQLVGQDIDSVQVTDFEVGEHGWELQGIDSLRFVYDAVQILSDFRTGVMFFRFGGPDSGQKTGKELELRARDEERRFRNLQILPHYQQLTLVRARETRVSAPVFVRAAVES